MVSCHEDPPGVGKCGDAKDGLNLTNPTLNLQEPRSDTLHSLHITVHYSVS